MTKTTPTTSWKSPTSLENTLAARDVTHAARILHAALMLLAGTFAVLAGSACTRGDDAPAAALQAAGAIVKTRLLQETERRAQQLSSLNVITPFVTVPAVDARVKVARSASPAVNSLILPLVPMAVTTASMRAVFAAVVYVTAMGFSG